MTDAPCPECDATGQVEIEYVVGGISDAGGPWQTYRVRLQECEECHGRGVVRQGEDES